MLLSGAGLVRLHRLLAVIEGRAPADTSEASIIAQCQAHDPTACATLSRFSALLGGFAGDAVLGSGAYGGAWLGGGHPRSRPMRAIIAW